MFDGFIIKAVADQNVAYRCKLNHSKNPSDQISLLHNFRIDVKNK